MVPVKNLNKNALCQVNYGVKASVHFDELYSLMENAIQKMQQGHQNNNKKIILEKTA